jgi:hypothetical protein
MYRNGRHQKLDILFPGLCLRYNQIVDVISILEKQAEKTNEFDIMYMIHQKVQGYI